MGGRAHLEIAVQTCRRPAPALHGMERSPKSEDRRPIENQMTHSDAPRLPGAAGLIRPTLLQGTKPYGGQRQFPEATCGLD